MFEMETSRDLLAALHDDLAAFASEPNSSRMAFHCATTAYHLHDWIWHEYLEKGGLRQGALLNWCEHFGKRKDFSAWISQRFPKFQALADLVNGGKHLNQSYANKEVFVGQPQFMFGVPGAGMGQGQRRLPEVCQTISSERDRSTSRDRRFVFALSPLA